MLQNDWIVFCPPADLNLHTEKKMRAMAMLNFLSSSASNICPPDVIFIHFCNLIVKFIVLWCFCGMVVMMVLFSFKILLAIQKV